MEIWPKLYATTAYYTPNQQGWVNGSKYVLLFH